MNRPTMDDALTVLCGKLANLPDVMMRVKAARSYLEGHEDEAVLYMLERCYIQAFGSVLHRDSLLAWLFVLKEPEFADRQVQLRSLAVNLGLELSPYLLRLHGSSHDIGNHESSRVPDYSASRPLTLGERKALARKNKRKLLERVVRDPAPEVVDVLLDNPRLTESDVVGICAKPGVAESILLRVHAHPRWIVHSRVKRALACNARLPLGYFLFLFPQLLRADREHALDSRRLPPDLSVLVRQLHERPLSPRSGHPEPIAKADGDRSADHLKRDSEPNEI